MRSIMDTPSLKGRAVATKTGEYHRTESYHVFYSADTIWNALASAYSTVCPVNTGDGIPLYTCNYKPCRYVRLKGFDF